MFPPEWREKIRAEILEAAKSDSRLSGGAITGSMSVGQLDAWSDIDLAFGVRAGITLAEVLETYTAKMFRDYGAVHYLDVTSGAWIYRVFLLANTLQVDLAFVPEGQFGALAPTFKLVFGKAASLPASAPSAFESYVGWCWLNALHVRSSLKRNRPWQAEFFLNGMRDYLISLYCRRHGLPEREGRGVDRLPKELLAKLEPTLARSIDLREQERAFLQLTHLCLEEIELVDRALAQKIKPAMLGLAT